MVNCFTYTDVDVETKEVNTFVICAWRNELTQFLEYLEQLKGSKKHGMVGFNNLHFDWPVVRAIMHGEISTAEQIYGFVQKIINEDKPSYTAQDIPQLDLFLLNHYDNKSRNTSLKALEVSLGWDNVLDMPFDHRTPIDPVLLEKLLEYNLNDVLFTAHFYEQCREKIELRKKIGKKYKMNVINKSDVVIGESIFIKYMAEAMDISPSELKKVRGKKKNVYLKDIIFPYISFKHKNFNDVLNLMKETKTSPDYFKEFINGLSTNTTTEELFVKLRSHNIPVRQLAQKKKSFSFSTRFGGIHIDYGVGGIHGCIQSGVYRSSDTETILDIDVKSFYPNLFIQNGLHPAHMDKDTFVNVYKEIYAQRLDAQSNKDQLTSDALKLALNGVFGKTGSDVSCFFDPAVFYSITVNGQLLLSMLAEHLNYAGAELLQINTDGVTIRYNNKHHNAIMKVCKDWEKLTKLTLEYAEYEAMFIRDVNNYIAVRKDGKVKEKGIFETKKEWHKDNSFMVIPKAVREYLINNTPIEEFLKQHDNLLDFCGRYKATKGWHVEYIYLDGLEEKRKNYGKIYRYIPVYRGGISMKINVDGREHHLCEGVQTVPYNSTKEIVDHKNIHLGFFISECQKLIQTVQPIQLSLV
jgi:hypothetical protein